MIPITTVKRSPAMTETEARAIARDTHLFGYEPTVSQIGIDWYLMVRGCGSDDSLVDRQLAKLRPTP